MRKTLHIKNMVCNRCIKVVREELEKLDYVVEKIELGEVVITSIKKDLQIAAIKRSLRKTVLN